ncbi:hypothetical protein C5167_044059 [Papaver somniferum]|uniref:Uncharacterized protein n=1 Tax=Papaver somniferum TaxID=3469 RepID=A0A4Y7LBC3_PAPSO|nr:hypothetical protein C5167_044059 [Papaver somniferum]
MDVMHDEKKNFVYLDLPWTIRIWQVLRIRQISEVYLEANKAKLEMLPRDEGLILPWLYILFIFCVRNLCCC